MNTKQAEKQAAKQSKVKHSIKHRWTDKVLFECDVPEGIESGLHTRYVLEKAAEARADLSGADISGADLSRADLSRADLSGADLSGADLSRADLSGADLSGADLSGADLSGADLSGAKSADLAIAKTRILPQGDLIGWKKCNEDVIVKLRIPESAKRSHAFGRMCRAEFAEVLEVIGAEFGITDTHGPKTEYRVGQRVTPDGWDDNWQDECSHGVHFYITREEAEAH